MAQNVENFAQHEHRDDPHERKDEVDYWIHIIGYDAAVFRADNLGRHPIQGRHQQVIERNNAKKQKDSVQDA